MGINNGPLNQIKLITVPNNPDNKIYESKDAHIIDACYNWPHYIKNPVEIDNPSSVATFSLSKLSGHSSSRIGWAITESSDLADQLCEYVELFTSGVSFDAQTRAIEVLSDLNDDRKYWSNGQQGTLFNIGQSTLTRRHNAIADIIKTYDLPIKILSEGGMFLYIETDRQTVFGLNISCFSGEDCGEGPASNKYRLNLGCSETDFVELNNRMAVLGNLYKNTNQ
jgi:aspartate/methionine/tyrosine aminotransferase